jgi:hypothetical protein
MKKNSSPKLSLNENEEELLYQAPSRINMKKKEVLCQAPSTGNMKKNCSPKLILKGKLKKDCFTRPPRHWSPEGSSLPKPKK